MAKKRVYIDGIFDMFHRGHLESFYKSKNIYGQQEYDNIDLIVGVISDKDAEDYKRQPIINEIDRYKIVDSLSIVNEVIFPAPLIITKEFIDKFKIDMIVHGFQDDNDFEKQKEFFKIPLELKKFKRIEYYLDISTTDIINKIKNNY